MTSDGRGELNSTRAMHHDRDPDTDIDRFDRSFIDVVRVAFRAQALYHRLEVHGLENMPRGAAIVAGNHNGGFNPVDALFLAEYYASRDAVPIHPLAHEVFFRVRALGDLMGRVGVLPANPSHARRAIERGHKVLVFPGSDNDSMRPYRDRARVFLAGRKGFARIAVQTGVPVVPLVTAGAQASFVVLTQGRSVARALRLDRTLHWHSLPITLSIPWGIALGPASFLPYFPAPVKVIVEVGEPIDPHDFDGDENTRVDAIYEATESQLQGRLTRLHNEGRVR